MMAATRATGVYKWSHSATVLAPGMMVTERVRLLHPLSNGAMGILWVAEHLTLEKLVAVKFISDAHRLSGPLLLARFEREAKTAARISSPYVAQMFDYAAMPDGTPFIIMELLIGETLGARLERGALPPREAVSVVTQIASVLDKAHQLGIVHRDIKPTNIFIMASGMTTSAKVLDFGVAKEISTRSGRELTATGMMLGTPRYMSPEHLADSKHVDKRVDLWSLAALAYVALTGSPAFVGRTVVDLGIAIRTARYTDATVLQPSLPAAVDAWFSRAFDTDPNRRFDSACEMALQLRDALEPMFARRTDETATDYAPTAPMKRRESSPDAVGGGTAAIELNRTKMLPPEAETSSPDNTEMIASGTLASPGSDSYADMIATETNASPVPAGPASWPFQLRGRLASSTPAERALGWIGRALPSAVHQWLAASAVLSGAIGASILLAVC